MMCLHESNMLSGNKEANDLEAFTMEYICTICKYVNEFNIQNISHLNFQLRPMKAKRKRRLKTKHPQTMNPLIFQIHQKRMTVKSGISKLLVGMWTA